MDSDGGKMGKKKFVVIGVVIAIVVIVAVVVGILLYKNSENPTGQQPEQGSSETGAGEQGTTQEPEPEIETEEYPIPDFVTSEMKQNYNSIYRTQGLSAAKDAVYQDFNNHGVEFNWDNPHHTMLLNFQEEFSQ
jgi:flagellar basal body-associated protein FliL